MSSHKLNEPWTAYVVSRCHRCDISQAELANRCGFTPSYLSKVLNCKKIFGSEESFERTKNHILGTVEKMADEILGGAA